MRKKLLHAMIAFLVFQMVMTPASWAGQVVTEELSSWAKNAIEQEKTISAVTAPNTIGILYFHNNTGQANFDPLQKGLPLMLMTDLAQVDEIQVVERVKLQALVEELDLGVSGLVDSQTAPRVGKLLGVRFLEGGEIFTGQITELQIDPNLLDVPDNLVFAQDGVQGDLNELISIEKEILFDIIRLMKIKLTPEQKADLEKPLSISVAALLLLFKGIDASDAGNYEMAADFYQKALKEDPTLDIAKDALKEVKELNLQTKKAEEPIKAKAEKTVPKAGGSAGKWALGLLAVGGLAAGAAALAGGGLNEEEPTPTPTPTPTPRPGSCRVVSTLPVKGSRGVSRDLSRVSINFSASMNRTGQVSSNSSDWAINQNAFTRWSNNSRTLTIERQGDNRLPAGETIEFYLRGFTCAQGNALEPSPYTLRFTLSTTNKGGLKFRW